MACMLDPRRFTPLSIPSNFSLVALAIGAELITSGELVFGTLSGDRRVNVASFEDLPLSTVYSPLYIRAATLPVLNRIFCRIS